MTITEICDKAKIGDIYQCTKSFPGGHIYTVGKKYEVLEHCVFRCVLSNNYHTGININYCQDGDYAQFKKVKK